MTWPAAEGAEGLQKAVERICHEATDAVLADQNILILSDRTAGKDRIAIPAALATAAVHHHLIRQGLRMQTGLVIERSEEHTSELQSLMRISYAVFCLKKKKDTAMITRY